MLVNGNLAPVWWCWGLWPGGALRLGAGHLKAREICFIFFAMAVGLAMGMGYPPSAY